MKVTVDGKPRQVNIGCRSFVRVTQLLELLALPASSNPDVTVNGKRQERQAFAFTQIKSGDVVSILLSGAP